MPQVIETTLVDVRVSVTTETKTRPHPENPEDTLEIEFTVLSFADRHAGDIRVVRIPLDENALATVVPELAGRLDEDARRALISTLTGVVVPTASDIVLPR